MASEETLRLSKNSQWEFAISHLASTVWQDLIKVGNGKFLQVKESIMKGRELCRLMLAVAKAELGEEVTNEEIESAGDVSAKEIFQVFERMTEGPRVSAQFLKSECQKVKDFLDKLFEEGKLSFDGITYSRDYFRWLAYPFYNK
jgi:hypothetical protein